MSQMSQKFANIRNILIILLSKFDPKFYTVLSKLCCETKQSCRKNPIQFSWFGPKEKDGIILKFLTNERMIANNTLDLRSCWCQKICDALQVFQIQYEIQTTLMYIKSKGILVKLPGFHRPNCLTCSKVIVNKDFVKDVYFDATLAIPT